MSRRYQDGCLYREKRKSGPDVWVFRYRDGLSNRKQQIGSVEQLATKKAAMLACERLRANINQGTRSPRTLAELVAHYQEKEMPEDSGKSFSTRKAYRCYFKNWIVPAWGNYRLCDVKTVAVEEWLRSLALAPGTKAKMRNMLSTLFTHAMRYEWADRNPIKLVRQSAKRQSIPEVLTIEEIRALLAELTGNTTSWRFWQRSQVCASANCLPSSGAISISQPREIHLNRANCLSARWGAKNGRHRGNRSQWTRDSPPCCWTGRAHCPYNRDDGLRVRIRREERPATLSGPALRCRSISAPLQSGLES